MPETQRLKFYSILIPAVAGLLTSMWTQYTSVAERQVKAGYDALVESNRVQSTRIRNLETLLSALLVDSGRNSDDVAAVFGKPDPVLKLLVPTAHPYTHSDTLADAGVSADAAPAADAGVPTTPAPSTNPFALHIVPSPSTNKPSLRELAKDVAIQARKPDQVMPSFDSL